MIGVLYRKKSPHWGEYQFLSRLKSQVSLARYYEMKIFNTLLSAKNGTVIRDSRKADVKQYWEDNQAGKPLDPYDYADLTMYLATVKTVNKTKGAMRNACLSGDAAKCEQMINDNSKTITGPMAREWENLILEGGIELDERHRKTFENMGK